jgi:hypothetical protein
VNRHNFKSRIDIDTLAPLDPSRAESAALDSVEFLATRSGNTANGFDALAENTTGHDNMASGFATLSFNTLLALMGTGVGLLAYRCRRMTR